MDVLTVAQHTTSDGAAWKAGASGLWAAGLADYTAEDGFAVDPDVRFSLFPEHSPSGGEEAEVEH
ncbi:hypothetical protein SUDANB121_05883 (plasmid) [Nocardiopsis dassonvillei]|uniref:hypothetical protein n=1 Tax=Nocardiopsis dassonvillei TaxID=2014 RepID=UPI003F54DE6C